jgi:hypothetical protein
MLRSHVMAGIVVLPQTLDAFPIFLIRQFSHSMQPSEMGHRRARDLAFDFVSAKKRPLIEA